MLRKVRRRAQTVRRKYVPRRLLCTLFSCTATWWSRVAVGRSPSSQQQGETLFLSLRTFNLHFIYAIENWIQSITNIGEEWHMVKVLFIVQPRRLIVVSIFQCVFRVATANNNFLICLPCFKSLQIDFRCSSALQQPTNSFAMSLQRWNSLKHIFPRMYLLLRTFL